MGNRIILCGSVHLSRSAFERAQVTPLLELFTSAADDDVSFVPRRVVAKELFASDDGAYGRWARNVFDAPSEHWLFGCSMHDDDWANADPKALTTGLSGLKDKVGADFVVAYVEWRQQLDGAWRIDKGTCTAIESPPELSNEVATLIAEASYDEVAPRIRALLGI